MNKNVSQLLNYIHKELADWIKILLKEAIEEYYSDQILITQNKSEFLDAQTSADFIGESLSSFYRRTSNREIPHYKRGKKIFCKKSELIAWIEGGKKKSQQEIIKEMN